MRLRGAREREGQLPHAARDAADRRSGRSLRRELRRGIRQVSGRAEGGPESRVQLGEPRGARRARVDAAAQRVDEPLGDDGSESVGDEVEQRRFGRRGRVESGAVAFPRGTCRGLRSDEGDDVGGERIGWDAEDGAARQRAAGDAADAGGVREDERRATRLRPYEIERQPGIGDESRHGVGAGREGLGAEVDIDARDPTAAEEAAELVGRFEQHDAHAGAREIVGDRETRDAASDHDDVDRVARAVCPVVRHEARQAWTARTRSVRTSGSVSFGTPCPRLNTWARAARPAVSVSCTAARRTSAGAKSSAGSRLPCSVRCAPTRAVATSRGTR